MINLLRPLLLIALIAVAAPVTRAQSAASSGPVGLLEHTVPNGISGVSFPLLRPETARGTLVSNTATVVTWNELAGVMGEKLEAGQSYYLEILTGPHEGDRLDVDTAATIASADSTVTLLFGGSSYSTLPALAENALADALVSLRPQLTLAALPAMFSPGLTGHDDPDLADGIQLLGTTGFVRFHLTGDGETWRRDDGGADTDQRALVLPPDVSVVLDLKSGARQLTRLGPVRTNAFRKNLVVGHQAYATGFPVALPLADLNAGGTASNDAAAADTVQVFDPVAGGFVRYYLRADGTSWRRVGDTTDYADETLLTPDSVIIITRAEADDTYTLTPPSSR